MGRWDSVRWSLCSLPAAAQLRSLYIQRSNPDLPKETTSASTVWMKAWMRIKNAPLSFSFPSLRNGTFAHPNNGGKPVWPRIQHRGIPQRRAFSGIYWSHAAGGVVGGDSTLSSTEHGESSVLLFDEREGVDTSGRSTINIISGVGDWPGGSCWRCAAGALRLRGYVGGGVDGMTMARVPLGVNMVEVREPGRLWLRRCCTGDILCIGDSISTWGESEIGLDCTVASVLTHTSPWTAQGMGY